jgi:hypothetical protein
MNVHPRELFRTPHTAKALLVVGIFGVPFLVPFNGHVYPSYYREGTALAIVALAVLASEAARRFGARDSVALPLSAIAPLALLLVLLVQHFTAGSVYLQQLAIPAICLMVAAFAAIAAGALRLINNEAQGLIAMTLVIVGCVQSLVAVFEVALALMIDAAIAPTDMIRATGLLAQPNHLAALLSWALAATGFLASTVQVRYWVWLPTAALILIALSLTGSKAAYLYTLLALPLLTLLLKRGPPERKWWLPALLGLAFPAVDSLVTGGISVVTGATSTGTASRLMDTTTSLHRLNTAQDALTLFLNSPLLGVGAGRFLPGRFELTAPSAPAEYVINAHNAPLHLLAEVGMMGVLAVGVPLFLALRVAVLPANRALLRTQALPITLLAIMLLYSMVEFPLWHAYFLVATFALLGFLDQSAIKFPVSATMSRVISTASVVPVVVIGLLAWDFARLERTSAGLREGRIPLESVARTSASSMFQLEYDYLYLSQARAGSLAAFLDAPRSERLFSARPTPDVAVVRIVHLVYLNEPGNALGVVRATCRFSEDGCGFVINRLHAIAEVNPGPLVEFLAGHELSSPSSTRVHTPTAVHRRSGEVTN